MKFSIITVCYNAEKFIQETIESVLWQTNRDYEYIRMDVLRIQAVIFLINIEILTISGLSHRKMAEYIMP